MSSFFSISSSSNINSFLFPHFFAFLFLFILGLFVCFSSYLHSIVEFSKLCCSFTNNMQEENLLQEFLYLLLKWNLYYIAWCIILYGIFYCTSTFEDIVICSKALWSKWIYSHFWIYGNYIPNEHSHLRKGLYALNCEGILCYKTNKQKKKPSLLPFIHCYCSEAENSLASWIPCCINSWFFRIFNCPYSDSQRIDGLSFSFYGRIFCKMRNKKGGWGVGYSSCCLCLTGNLQKGWNLNMLIEATEKYWG